MEGSDRCSVVLLCLVTSLGRQLVFSVLYTFMDSHGLCAGTLKFRLEGFVR